MCVCMCVYKSYKGISSFENSLPVSLQEIIY